MLCWAHQSNFLSESQREVNVDVFRKAATVAWVYNPLKACWINSKTVQLNTRLFFKWLHFDLSLFAALEGNVSYKKNRMNSNFVLKTKQHFGFTQVDILEMHGFSLQHCYLCIWYVHACVCASMCLLMCMSDALSAGQRTLWLIPVCWLYRGLACPPLRAALRRTQHQTRPPASLLPRRKWCKIWTWWENVGETRRTETKTSFPCSFFSRLTKHTAEHAHTPDINIRVNRWSLLLCCLKYETHMLKCPNFWEHFSQAPERTYLTAC